MAWAQKALGGGHPAHGAAEVRAAVGDRDVGGVSVGGVGIDRGVFLANVGGGLAGVADFGSIVKRTGDVVVFGEVGPVPTASQCSTLRLKIGPIAKPIEGNTKAAVATAPAPLAVTVMNLRRVTVSPSNAPGMPRSSVYLDFCFARLSATGRKEYRRGIQDGAEPPAKLVRIASIASGAAASTSSLARACSSLGPQPTARAPAAHTASASWSLPAPCASALSVIVSASSDTAAVSPSATRRASPIAYSRSPASRRRSASATWTTRGVP